MDLPRPLSHSSISMYRECPLRYKFKYVDNIPEKPKHFFSFGQSVHKALEFFYSVKAPPAPTLKELLESYKAGWVSTGYRDEAQEAEYFQDGKDILTEYHRRHARRFQVPLSVEYSFDFSVDGVPVTGKVDRIDRLGDGRLSVLDYKTGRPLPAARVQEDPQLTMYQLACETLLSAEVGRLVFYHLPTHKEHVVERRPAAMVDLLRRRIADTAEGIKAERFDPNPAEKTCAWCDFKGMCPVFGGVPAEPASPGPQEELAGLIDSYGDVLGRLAREEKEAARLKAAILDILRRKGYVRAFGSRYELVRAGAEKWEFPEQNKKKVLHLLKEAGLYERVLAPSAPLIQKLLGDETADESLRLALRELGSRKEAGELKVTPL